jgi:CHAT domain-containing protein
LIYDYGITPAHFTFCAWLIDQTGAVASSTSAFARGEVPSIRFRELLNVKARAWAHLRGSVPVEPVLPTSRTSLSEVSEQVLTPIIQRAIVAGGYQRLLILPAADLGNVPFAVLPITDPRTAGSKTLIDYVAPVVLPDLEGLVAVDFSPILRGSHLTNALVVGDPDNSLRGAREEAQEVAGRLGIEGSRLLLGREASHQAVLDGIDDRVLLHFASHGMANPKDPMDESYILLADRRLTGQEIKSVHVIEGGMVIMSACQTGLGKVFGGGVFGLPRAWFSRGATRVIMSLWDIDDNATRFTISAFYDALLSGSQRGLRPEYALRDAILKAKERFPNDPGKWGALAFYGLPTSRE